MSTVSFLKSAAITAVLQRHQEDAVQRSRQTRGLILNHGLGSGKTVSSLAIAEDRGGNVLVVCPASLEANFRKEIERFVTPDRIPAYTVMSYSKFREQPLEVAARVRPNTLICDEIHRARNPTKSRAAIELVKKETGVYILGLTASLVNNHPLDAIRLVNLVAPSKVMTEEDFARRHLKDVKVDPGLWGRLRGVKPGTVTRIKNPQGIKDALKPHVHRFTGSEEYKAHLPDKIETRVDVEMDERQIKLINYLAGKNPLLAYKIRNNLPPSKREAASLNAFMTGMRQVSNTPAPYDQGDAMSPKIRRMLEDIDALADGNPRHKTVTYSRYLDGGARPVLEQTGGTMYEGGISKQQRKELVEAYNAGDVNHIGVSPAGNEGIDLKGTRLLQVMEPDWNPETIEQAIGRGVRYKSHAHLPEEERNVEVRRYVSVHPKKWYQLKRPGSPDEYLLSRAVEKQELNAAFLDALEEVK